MAKAMITLTWCDYCLTEKDLEIPAQGFQVGDFQVDLCEEHALPLLESQKLAETYGSKGKRTPTLAGPPPKPTAREALGIDPLACPVPGCGKSFGGRQSLGAHTRTEHGISLGEAEGKPIVARCEEHSQGFTTQAGYALHISQKHKGKPRRRGPSSGRSARSAAAAPAGQG